MKIMQWITLLVSVFAFILSFSAYRFSSRDSYLSHRAYVAPASWSISASLIQFQFTIFNAGQTPGLELSAHGQLIIDSSPSDPVDLLNGHTVTVFQNIPEGKLPKFGFDINSDEFSRLCASTKNHVVLTLDYKDYLKNRKRRTITNFVVLKTPDGRGFQLQQVSQTLE